MKQIFPLLVTHFINKIESSWLSLTLKVDFSFNWSQNILPYKTWKYFPTFNKFISDLSDSKCSSIYLKYKRNLLRMAAFSKYFLMSKVCNQEITKHIYIKEVHVVRISISWIKFCSFVFFLHCGEIFVWLSNISAIICSIVIILTGKRKKSS